MDALADLLDGIFRLDARVYDQNVLADLPLVFAPENYPNCRVIPIAFQVGADLASKSSTAQVHVRVEPNGGEPFFILELA